jgi:hypothetical protein
MKTESLSFLWCGKRMQQEVINSTAKRCIATAAISLVSLAPSLHYSQKWSTEEFFRESEQP